MNEEDSLRNLWQKDNSPKENRMIWKHLIEEKRSRFEEQIRAGNGAEYMVAITLSPLLGLLAWKAKFPLVQMGYGLLSLTLLAMALATWLTHRQWPQTSDHSLRDHLTLLIACYDRRIRFLRNGKALVSLPMCGGVLAVVMGIPNQTTGLAALILTSILLLAFLAGQWWSYRDAKLAILKKRGDAAGLLTQLSTGPI
jgi:hypothetical protein